MHEHNGWVWRESVGQTEISHDPILAVLKRQGFMTVDRRHPLESAGFSRASLDPFGFECKGPIFIEPENLAFNSSREVIAAALLRYRRILDAHQIPIDRPCTSIRCSRSLTPPDHPLELGVVDRKIILSPRVRPRSFQTIVDDGYPNLVRTQVFDFTRVGTTEYQ